MLVSSVPSKKFSNLKNSNQKVAARWNFINFQTPTYTAVMMEFTTPPSYGSTVVNVGGIVKDGEIIYAGTTNSATHTEAAQDQDSDWPEPKSIKWVWDGKSKDEKLVHAEVEGPLGKRLDRIDVMAEVPGFIKTIAGSVAGTRPYIFQVRLFSHNHLLTCYANRYPVCSPREAYPEAEDRR
jgi:hypothetical protein